MVLAREAGIVLSARLDKTHPRRPPIGEDGTIAFCASTLTHAFIDRRHSDAWTGKLSRCMGPPAPVPAAP